MSKETPLELAWSSKRVFRGKSKSSVRLNTEWHGLKS